MKKNRIRKSNWNTYAVHGYAYDIANCQLSAGGVHIYQVRLGKHGWIRRIVQSNGNHKAYTPVIHIDDYAGECLFERAKTY